jgi:hypothetical protein
MSSWQLDFKDVSSVPADPDGKQQHVVETFNVVDVGTSILLEAVVRDDFTSETALMAVTHTLREHGRPDHVTFDRDPRFVGSWTGRDFPSPLVRFLLCLDIEVIICPPQRPDKNAFVERYHRSYAEECLGVHLPQTCAAADEVTQAYRQHYNWERPNQAVTCGNQRACACRLATSPVPSSSILITGCRRFDHRYCRRIAATVSFSSITTYYVRQVEGVCGLMVDAVHRI